VKGLTGKTERHDSYIGQHLKFDAKIILVLFCLPHRSIIPLCQSIPIESGKFMVFKLLIRVTLGLIAILFFIINISTTALEPLILRRLWWTGVRYGL